MANIAGSGGGGFWGKPAPAKASPPPRGGKPVTFPGPHTGSLLGEAAHGLHVAVHALVHGAGHGQTAQQYAAAHGTGAVGAPLFTPLSLGIDQLLNAPQIVASAHAQAVKLAHPSAQNPPSLGREVKGLLGGALGVPFMAVGKNGEVIPPKVPRGTSTPATGGDLGRQVREGLRGAAAARTEQEKLYSAERGSRAAAAQKAMTEHGGQAGYQAALGALKGELPKLQFGGFENFDQAGLDALFTHIQNHPELRPFEKIRAQTALLNALNGKVPTRGDLNVLGQVFGKEVSGRIAASVPFAAKAKNLGIELWNVPRSLMSSFDLSAPFRQGLVSGVRHPVMFGKNFAPMLRAFRSEGAYRTVMDEIASRPTFPQMQKSGLALTDLGTLDQREEQFVSNIAEKLNLRSIPHLGPVTGAKYATGPGDVVRASGRAYTAFLTKMRADMFDHLMQAAEAQGLNTNDEKLVTSVARYINSATGRGSLGAFQKHAVTLNSLFFSPRLLASRLNFLNPVYYARLDPFARKEAMKAALALIGTVGLTLELAKLNGAQVNTDPRNADFAKMKIGDTRIDVLGGFQQPVRLVTQLASGKVISSTTGKVLSLGPQGPGKLSRWDIAERFAISKLSPSPSFIHDAAVGTDSTGAKLHWGFTLKNPFFQRMLPLVGQDAYDVAHQYNSPALGAGAYGLAAFGIGIQTYGPKPPSARSGGGGSSGFWGSPTGGSSGSTGSFWGP